MKLLCGFVNAMKGIGVADNLKIEFEQIDTILNASTELPDDVSAAIQRVRASCAGSAERGCVLLPSLEGLATGKRLMELAEQTRKSREEAFAYLHELSELRSQLAEISEKEYSADAISSYNMTAHLIIHVDNKVPQDHRYLLEDTGGWGVISNVSVLNVFFDIELICQ